MTYYLVLDKNDPTARFEAPDRPNNWSFINMQKAAQSGDENLALAALHDLIMRCVKKTERARLNEWLLDYEGDEDFDVLMQDAISRLAEDWAGRPLAESSSSSEPTTSSPKPSRVISLSRGTVQLQSEAV